MRPLSSRELLARLAQSPQIELLHARIDRARAEVTRAGLWANPSFSITREDVAGSPENVLSLELPLEISGRRGRSVDAAESKTRAAEAGVARETLLLELDALAIYYAVAAARARVTVLATMHAAIDHRVAELRKRTDQGDASGYELGRLEIELAAHQDLLARESQQHHSLQRTLSMIAGEPTLLFEPSDSLSSTTPPSLSAMMSEALERRADYRAAQLRKQSAEQAWSAAKRGWIPSLTFSGGMKAVEVEQQTKLGYVAGLGLSLPLFDHGQADGQLAAAELREANAELRRLELEIPAELSRVHRTLVFTIEQARRFEQELLPKLDALVRRAESNYREGERPVFELLDAYRTAREHHLRQIDLWLAAKYAELELRRASGERS